MGITTGRTKTLALVMDVEAVLMRQRKRYTEFLAGVDNAIAVDLSDDRTWKAAEDQLCLAIELEDPENKQSTLLKALNLLRQGMQIDFGDRTKEMLKERIVPDEKAIERLLDRCREIAGELDGKGKS